MTGPAAAQAGPDSLLVGPILPKLLRFALPNMGAMLATALAAIALIFPFVMLQMMLSAGAMGGGVSSAVSRALGAGDTARANALAVHALWIALAVGTVYMALMELFGSVLQSARSYFLWAGPCYGLFGLGLSLYFSSLGAGKAIGPVLAGTLRLVIVAAGGALLAYLHAPVWAIFALVGAGMAAYGLSSLLIVRYTPWK
jgi:Na+-driven multidrug efflux pump